MSERVYTETVKYGRQEPPLLTHKKFIFLFALRIKKNLSEVSKFRVQIMILNRKEQDLFS